MGRVPAVALCLALVACAVPLAGCASPSVEERTRVNEEGGYRYVVPIGWREVQGEVRSPNNTLVSVQVVSLDYGDDAFIAGLPRTVLPQLEAWARKLYQVVDSPAEAQSTLGGEPALLIVYPVRTRPEDPLGHIAYRVARHRQNLFVMRAAFPHGTEVEDARGLDELLATWRYLDAAGVSAPTPAVTTP
jgi:hypothetical protein